MTLTLQAVIYPEPGCPKWREWHDIRSKWARQMFLDKMLLNGAIHTTLVGNIETLIKCHVEEASTEVSLLTS